jgi:hypothetical protein
MGGLVETLNPAEGLKKLTVGVYEYRLVVEGEHEDSEMLFDVIAFPTTGTYHIKFTDVRGFNSTSLKDWLKHDLLIFKTETIEMNMDNGTVSIELEEQNSNICWHLENIKNVIRMTQEQIEVTKEDIMNNEYFQKAINPSRKSSSIFGALKGLFGK